MTETALQLGSYIIPVGAGRGITQTLQIIDNGALRRTINGELLDLTRFQNRKYESQIRCTDMSTPTFAEAWKGQSIEVHCIAKIRQLIDPESTSVTLTRLPVTGSVIGYDNAGNKVQPDSLTGQDVTFPLNVQVVQFKPILTMLIDDVSIDDDEYAAEESWVISLQEV